MTDHMAKQCRRPESLLLYRDAYEKGTILSLFWFNNEKKKKIETDWKQVKRSSISYQQLCNTLLFWRILLYAVIWLILHSNHLCLCLCSSGTSKWLTISVNLHSSLTDLNQEKQHDSQRDFKSTSKQQMYISVQLSEWQMNLFQDILQYICLVRAGNFW